MTDSRSGMFTIMALAVLLLACAGTAAGATTWVVDDAGGADFTSIQAAVDTVEVQSGTCEDDVVNVKFRGVVTGHPDFSCLVGASGINVQIDKILSDPTANLEIGDTVTVAFAVAPPFCYINDKIGDDVEVYSVYRDIGEMPDCWLDVGEHWVWLWADHYFKILDQPAPPDRSLLELEHQLMIYWFQNSRYYSVMGWDVINNMSGVPGWDNVITLEFNPAGYPNGANFITNSTQSDGTRSNGLLIREQGHLEVYLISGGEKHHFTSPEALLWNGHSFDDVIDVSAAIIGMFPTGRDIGITQAIINKYNDLGGEATFGVPAGTGEQSGYPDISGVVCSYVSFQNGAIECFTSGDYAGNAYAILNPFFDKWASMEYENSVLGYPISDMSDVQTSSFGTPSRYQKFINGTEEGSLEYNLTSGEVFAIHGAIYAKWSAMGYSNSILGLVTSDEREAVPSFKGTTGRVSNFENGHLHWHSSGEHEGVTYVTYSELDDLYASIGGTASWLGFPVMDQEERDGHGYCEFEGGYIEWDGSEYKAKSGTPSDEGLVAEWHFDENSGNILRDTSGNGNDGTIYGATWATGKFGSALQFDGVDDYVEVPDSPELSGGTGKNMTVEFWFTSNKQFGHVITKWKDINYKDWGAGTGYWETSGLNFWYENRGYDRRFYGGTIEEGVWHHGAFTFQRSTAGNNAILKMYLDGNELQLTPFYQDGVPANQLYDMPDTTAPVSIGYSGKVYNNGFLDGRIDEIKIYNRVLSADEIKAKYPKPVPVIITNRTMFDGRIVVEENKAINFSGSEPYDEFGSIVSYEWELGDGTEKKMGVNVEHVYSQMGEYQVKLTVKNKDGVSSQTSVKVYVVKEIIKFYVIPTNFRDVNLNEITEAETREIFGRVQNYYIESAYNSLYLDYSIEPSITISNRGDYKTKKINGIESDFRDQIISDVLFKKYGGNPPHLNHIITLNTCEDVRSCISNRYPPNIVVDKNDDYATWAHEVGHSMGYLIENSKTHSTSMLPDLYGLGKNICWWGLMGEGIDVVPPTHHSSFSKLWLNWLTPFEVSYGEQPLKPLEKSRYGDPVYIFSVNKNIAYIIEARDVPENYIKKEKLQGKLTDGTLEKGVVIYKVENFDLVRGYGINANWKINSVSRPIGTDQKWFIDDPTLLAGDGTSAFPYIDLFRFVAFSISSTTNNPYYQPTVKIETPIEYASNKIGNAINNIKIDIPSIRNPFQSPGNITRFPDIDLHAYTQNGLHVGTNHSANIYEIQIPGAIASGDLDNGEEWIFVPKGTNVTFYVSSHDVQKFFEANPELNASNVIIEYSTIFMEYGLNPKLVQPPDGNWMVQNRTSSKPQIEVMEPGEVKEIILIDGTPPATITNLGSTNGTSWLNWTWTNPIDPDFNHTEIYLNDVFQTITSAEHFNATDLSHETSYTISTRTVDTAGNISQTWVNDTATPLPTPTPPPTPAPTPINYEPVPAITPPGILSLIALLALAGFVVLRRKE